jgi:hypothetical protein
MQNQCDNHTENTFRLFVQHERHMHERMHHPEHYWQLQLNFWKI